ncbi:MAG: HNH endonuclease, partial [Candidatus Dormibacteria bacterium]
SITCTPNHKFLLRDKTYIEAQYLKVGDSLMPFYEQGSGPYPAIYLNDGSKGLEHHLVYQRFKGDSEPHTHIDHKDEIYTHNNPDNLQLLSPAEYCSKTFKGKNNKQRKKEINDYIPYSSNNKCYKHRYSIKCFNHKVRFIRKGKSQDVYDIEVPETHNFVAEGVVLHNSHALRALEYYCWNLTHGDVGGVIANSKDKFKEQYFADMTDEGQMSVDLDLFK